MMMAPELEAGFRAEPFGLLHQNAEEHGHESGQHPYHGSQQ
jgi:hypothetical protein